ncbi:NAD(P)-dependent oxidoreductase [Oleiagrimonas sp. C23AA]|nr:NAD(P)-dependent oxidoreductase [Oleiagrimonas sp. C23AA]
MSAKPTVAVIGLGAMGHAFAANLLKNGFTTQVWNRTRSRADDLHGAQVGDSPKQAAAKAEIVMTMVTDAETTEKVIFGDDGVLAGLKSGGVLVQMGTIGVAQTDALIKRVAEARDDVAFIDAPVSGTKTPAEQAKILVLASGGDEATRTRVQPVFDAIAKGTKWLGEAGRGARMKLVVNAWLITLMQAVAETTRLAETVGFSGDDFWDALEGGPLAAPYVRAKLDKITGDDFEAQMALQWGLKDARLALQAAGDTAMPALRTVAEQWSDAVDAGLGEKDIAAVYQYLKAKG